jgi:serine protease Do
MRSWMSWIAGGAILIVAGIVLGVMITANYDWAPVSTAQVPATERTAALSPAAAMMGESPFVTVADELLPAVVSVDTKRTVTRGSDPFQDMFRDFFGDRMYRDYYGDEDPQREYEIPGSASGFIFDDRGYVMTNNHVVDGADEVVVTLDDGREFEAEVVGQDPSTDVAVLRIEGSDLPVVRLGDSDNIRVGDWAIAIGNPLELQGTVTVGVISAVGRADLNIRGGAPIYQDFIQTDASINYGNSGGPLVSIRGEVIGVNSAINPAANGIGFAIPINLAAEVAEALMERGRVVRGYLGVFPQEITKTLAEAQGLEGVEGVLIASVEEDTPADEAGLEPGDVIIEFDDVPITTVSQFRIVVAGVAPGERTNITVLRDGKRRRLTATLSERPGEQVAEAEEPEPEPEAWFGIDAVDVDHPMARELGIEAEHGVVVVRVESGSPADDGGLMVGDVIQKVADREVANLDDYTSIMKDMEGRTKAVAFMVRRGQYTYFVAVRPDAE